ncbi:MAG: hypothetical protein QXW39_06960, partial [Candidatus Bathyarchaeia archaeon]
TYMPHIHHSQCPIAVEPLLTLVLNLSYPLHGCLYTFLLAALLGLFLEFFMASALGTIFQVFLDSPLYDDIRPLFPYH